MTPPVTERLNYDPPSSPVMYSQIRQATIVSELAGPIVQGIPVMPHHVTPYENDFRIVLKPRPDDSPPNSPTLDDIVREVVHQIHQARMAADAPRPWHFHEHLSSPPPE